MYNVEKYLDKCLYSLIKQTKREIEIIVVNDGSTDNSQLIIDKYKDKYKDKVISLIKENGGLSDARNYGLKYAKGNYIGFVDPDDWVELDMYEKLFNYAIEKNADIVLSDFIFEPDNKISSSNLVKDSRMTFNNNPELLFVEPSVCNKLFKKSLFDDHAILFPYGLYHEDRVTIIQLYYHSKSIYYIGGGFYHYLKHRENSITTSLNIKKYTDIMIVLEKNNNFLVNNNCNLSIMESFNKLVIDVYILFSISAIEEIQNEDIRVNFLDDYRHFILTTFPLFKSKSMNMKKKVIITLLINRFYKCLHLLILVNKWLK